MSKLHQLIAVEPQVEDKYQVLLKETIKAFSRPELFTGYHKRYEPFDEDPDKEKGLPDERQQLTTTVDDKLNYFFQHAEEYFDLLYQKEVGNQTATADLVFEGSVIAEKVPATFLLGMEKRLTKLRSVLLQIPTLETHVEWKKREDIGPNIWSRKHPEEKNRTRKVPRSKVLYEATKEHPAQIEKWDENETIGRYITDFYSGNIPASEKSRMLDRLDKLIIATKKARQLANEAKVNQKETKIASKLLTVILKGV